MKEKAQKLIQELKSLIEDIHRQADNPEIDEKRKQLQAVEKSVQQLQKSQIAIPDELRHLKTKLVSEVDGADQIEQQLEWITQELIKILKTLGISAATNNSNKTKTKRATGPKTENQVLREYIIKALKHFGGRSSVNEVLDWIEAKLKDRFTPRDLSQRQGGEIVWRNNTQWERYIMVQDGILKSDSPRGIWELSEEYK